MPIKTAKQQQYGTAATLEWVTDLLAQCTKDLTAIDATIEDIDQSENPAEGKALRDILGERVGQIDQTVRWCVQKINQLKPPAAKPQA